jgi:uroporphyrinogen decarboxylase
MYMDDNFKMTQRGRYLRFIEKQEPGMLPLWGDWVGPYDIWVRQGLPAAPDIYYSNGGELMRRAYLRDYFGFEGIYSCYWGTGRLPVNLGLCPPFERKTISQSNGYELFMDGEGVITKRRVDAGLAEGAAQYFEKSLHGPADWPKFRDDHLIVDHPGHYPPDAEWDAIVERCKSRDSIVTVDAGSFYGKLRNWAGIEGISYLLHDEPGWVEEVADYLTDYYIAVLRRAVTDIPDIDCALFWEDMCYKTGPLCSPAMFREFFLPGYKKVTKFLRENGVVSFWVDCDGNIEQLIDLWLEGGVNGFYPLEAASGMDAYEIKRKYGDKVLLWGGVDKRAIAAGPEAIERELAKAKRAAALGGYIPLCDHGVPDDVSFENFCYYDRRRKEIFGLAKI